MKNAILAALALVLTVPAWAADQFASPGNLEVTVNRSRSTKVAGGDFDDKTQVVALDLSFKNTNPNLPQPPLTATYWAFGEDVNDRKLMKVILKGSFAFTLGADSDSNTASHTSEQVALQFDDRDYAKFGVKYDGWLTVVRDADGKVVKVKASKSALEKHFEAADSLSAGDQCNAKLETLSSVPSR